MEKLEHNQLQKNQLIYYKDFLTVEDLQVYLSIGRNTALEIMKGSGYIIGSSYKIDKETVKQILNVNKQNKIDKGKYRQYDDIRKKIASDSNL